MYNRIAGYKQYYKSLVMLGVPTVSYTHLDVYKRQVLYEANVFLTPGFIFGSRGERYIRISLCRCV